MNWLVRVGQSVKDTAHYLMDKKFEQTVGTATGTTASYISQFIYGDWITRLIFTVVCAGASLIVTHYGKKILTLIDKKLKL